VAAIPGRGLCRRLAVYAVIFRENPNMQWRLWSDLVWSSLNVALAFRDDLRSEHPGFEIECVELRLVDLVRQPASEAR